MNAMPSFAGTFRIALGIGCDRGTPQATIASAVAGALAAAGLSDARIVAVASITLKADEAGLLSCAAAHGWPLHFYPPAELDCVQVPHPSAIVRRHTGSGSVSAAAALRAAGAVSDSGTELSALLLEKHTLRGADGRNVTVSIARCVDHSTPSPDHS
ncbi:cobalamin biosynthesis protein [Rhodocyclus gracilis]|nr:cobalamin biosynthesis protein [Rhodocyclus gracilis]